MWQHYYSVYVELVLPHVMFSTFSHVFYSSIFSSRVAVAISTYFYYNYHLYSNEPKTTTKLSKVSGRSEGWSGHTHIREHKDLTHVLLTAVSAATYVSIHTYIGNQLAKVTSLELLILSVK